MRRLLRTPRYFDDDFEAAALRCFRCGGSGHAQRECVAPPRERPCFLCGLFGHTSRDCPHELCFNCARPGHQARDCSAPRGGAPAGAACLRCGSRSHAVAACDRDYEPEDVAALVCYVCGGPGHLCCAAASAAQDTTLSCFRCGGSGHVGFHCSVPRAPPAAQFGGGGGGDGLCFRCGEPGHQARFCPSAGRTTGMGFRGAVAEPEQQQRSQSEPRQRKRPRPSDDDELLYQHQAQRTVTYREPVGSNGARSSGRAHTRFQYDDI